MDNTKAPTTCSTEQIPLDPSEATSKADRWRISYRVPLGMLMFMLVGIAFALAHHLYYNSLNGEPVTGTSQEWAVRIGTGLAFLTKAFLIASAAISYHQHYWRVLRTRPVSVQSIDDIMGLLANPTCFFNLEVVRKAWSSALIALAIWCLPLAAIMPPASLTASFSAFPQHITSPVAFVNWTQVSYEFHAAAFAMFTDASPAQYSIITSSAYTGAILPMVPLYPNYTYTLTFQGPRFRCGDVKNQTLVSEALIIKPPKAGFGATPFNATTPSPSLPLSSIPPESRYDLWFYTPTRNFSCETWNVTYTANFSFANGEQNIAVTDVRFDNRFGPGPEVDTNMCFYDWCGYRGWYRAITSLLTGYVYMGGATGDVTMSTNILQTTLVGCPEMNPTVDLTGITAVDCPAQSLEAAVELLSENATLSFFSAVPSIYFKDLRAAKGTTIPADLTVTTMKLVHAYNARSLLLSYAVAIFATIIILVAGLHALWSNGVGHTNTFSALVRTTRNQDLDDWARGHCLGSDPIDKHIASQKLQFGLLAVDSEGNQSNKLRHAAFGFKGTVTRLEKGDKCM